ncbi:MAG: UvrD-helicase domain-containing protein [Cytophagales bacterium]|nr:UvrD-helicase domain-containing protein [Cytophagales bacterium]MCA6365441.1 UvrD-helicase domain-containing protein [Cytophagales bacterium]MCA6370307.1 UvrD-helicase domain-containing protein [Cytophagales bacterium]MCA6376513.1 UvrD-helicase domain-containing protein [Cytophagales bacterium]MCA6385448.1 UvrD-helicase domain-containing protein [Cytophagales bacterium]
MEKPFHIYRSSAGSGKTRVLAREYIRLALRRPDYFRYILAMTFTNKSTQEMKDRILQYLSAFSNGESQDLAIEIIEEQRKAGIWLTPIDLRKKSKEILDFLLHHYSEFSINTIDAFFQRIIRSFTRETGLLGNFRLEVDNAAVQEEVIALLMAQLKGNAELRSWVLDFSMEKMKDGNDWDVRKALLSFSKLIEKEDFKRIEDSVLRVTDDKAFFKTFRKRLNEKKYSIERTVSETAKQLMEEFEESRLVPDDFAGKSKGLYSYIRRLSKEVDLPSNTVGEVIGDPEKWAHKSSKNFAMIQVLARSKWQPDLATLVDFIQQNIEAYLSIDQVLKNLYSFGLLSDILRTQRKYLSDENVMLLSDAPQFLNKLMQEQDTSFIYEKVGSFYRHFLLDEFQDTSGLQWKNLLPLIQNGIAQNYSSLIVGDIKQSIYRWRGGDLSILQNQLEKDISKALTTTENLDTNYRSNGNIVSFNNALFETASQLIAAHTETAFPQEAYKHVQQKAFVEPTHGYVKIQFLESEEDMLFKEVALRRLPLLVEELQGKGIAIKDIAFLVRDNREGKLIANRFMEYRTSPDAKEDYKYDVVSNESLMVDRASCVLVLLNALRVINNLDHHIARAHLAYEYQKLWPTQAFSALNELFSDSRTKSFEKWIPPSFLQQREKLLALPLFEMVENLIHIFNLGKVTNEVVYLQSFQDIIQEFSQREKNDVNSFLDWWELNRQKKSIQVAGGVNAAQIITIHKAKGLQFKYVIIPFLDWELGHKNKDVLLWCQSDHPLFRDAGFIPIKYVSKLEDTVFKEAYEEETRRVFLDNLNLLYVAFTRAELGLMAFAPEVKNDPKNEQKLTHVGQLVYKAINGNTFLKSSWSDEKKSLEIGEIGIICKRQENAQGIVSLTSYTVTPWRDRLQVRTSGMEFFSPSQKREKINYGIFLHALLSQIRTKQDVTMVITNAMLNGTINEREKWELEELINWVVDLPVLQPCFDAGSTSKTEASLFTTDGSERRIDRVVMKGDQVWVVDYKTGVPSAKDEAQVKDYLVLLGQMGWKRATGYLVYFEERKWVEVK